jgi:hypothetical protein
MKSLSLKTLWHSIQGLLQQKNIRRLLYAAIVLLSVAFIAYAIYKNWHELTSQKWNIDYRNIILATVLHPLGMLPTIVAWHKLLDALGVHKPFRTNLRVYALSSLPRHIPGLVLYVTSRTLMYQEQGVSTGIILVATGAETALLALTGFVLSFLILMKTSAIIGQFTAIRFLLPIAVILIFILIISTPILNSLFKRLVSRWNLENPPRLVQKQLIQSLLWMFVAWGGGGMLLFILVRAFSTLDWSYLPMMIGIWGVAGAVSLTIGIGVSGMGLREVTLGALLSLVISPLAAIVVAVAFRLVLTLGEFLWVLLFAWMTKTAPQDSGRQLDRK